MNSYRFLIVYVAAVVILSVAYFASPMSREAIWQLFPSLEAVAQANPFVTALSFFAISSGLTFLAFPAMPMVYAAAGFYSDGLEGGAIVLLGSAFGGLIAFLFYRKHIQSSDATLKQTSAGNIWLTLIGLRLSPLVPAPLVNFVAAIFHASPLQYLTTTLLGNAPLVLFYCQIGRQGHQFLSGDMLHWQYFSGYMVILVLSTLLSAMGPWRSMIAEFKQLKGIRTTTRPLQVCTPTITPDS